VKTPSRPALNCHPPRQPHAPPPAGAHGAFYYEGYGGGAAYVPSRVVIHPAYTGYEWNGDNEFDVAVVFLKECVKLSDRVQPIKLATKQGARAAGAGRWAPAGGCWELDAGS
jgi:hypothetical protein